MTKKIGRCLAGWRTKTGATCRKTNDGQAGGGSGGQAAKERRIEERKLVGWLTSEGTEMIIIRLIHYAVLLVSCYTARCNFTIIQILSQFSSTWDMDDLELYKWMQVN